MQNDPSNQARHPAPPTRASRRALVSWTMKLAGGAALAVSVPGTPWVQRAAAQDDEIILTAAASEIGARPGGAYANGAAARAAADSEAGSSTQGVGGVLPTAGGPGSGAGPGDSNGAGPGDQNGMGGGGMGGATGAGPGDQSGGGGGGTKRRFSGETHTSDPLPLNGERVLLRPVAICWQGWRSIADHS
jgi:hypothetical protein